MKPADPLEISFQGIKLLTTDKEIKVFPYMAKKELFKDEKEIVREDKVVINDQECYFIPKPLFDKIWIKAVVKNNQTGALNIFNNFIKP